MADLMRKKLAKELGVTPATVTRDAQKGMPTHDVDAARRWRLENRRARVAPPPRHPEGAAAAGPAQLPRREPAAENDPGETGDNYWNNRARREKAEADLAELKLAELKGQLVRADDVRAVTAKRMSALRESLLQIPARLAAVLAAEPSQARCHDILQAELHSVLQQITEANPHGRA